MKSMLEKVEEGLEAQSKPGVMLMTAVSVYDYQREGLVLAGYQHLSPREQIEKWAQLKDYQTKFRIKDNIVEVHKTIPSEDPEVRAAFGRG